MSENVKFKVWSSLINESTSTIASRSLSIKLLVQGIRKDHIEFQYSAANRAKGLTGEAPSNKLQSRHDVIRSRHYAANGFTKACMHRH